MTNEELLKVLDMSEDEQWEWCVKNVKSAGESLADLAFRLRNEVDKITNWWDACQCVYEYITKEVFDKDRGWKSETGIWFQDFAKPIHFVIAALIVKESK